MCTDKASGTPTLRARYHGALLGLAAGDALGTTLEFTRPGTFAPITDMIGGGPFWLAPGQWTDDTSMALCLAESLIECRGFEAADQMRRYRRWRDEGQASPVFEKKTGGVSVRIPRASGIGVQAVSANRPRQGLSDLSRLATSGGQDGQDSAG